uniref:SHSP domain-containing protein n=1 Tax=Romanomermis culicivorax TaxID=13658 RepID=A0A915J255_ROMCU
MISSIKIEVIKSDQWAIDHQEEITHPGKVWDWPLYEDKKWADVQNTEKIFQVQLIAPYFTASEIEVKILNKEMVIHCEHDEKAETTGSVSRQIHRSYRLPSDLIEDSLSATLKDGILTITAKKGRGRK